MEYILRIFVPEQFDLMRYGMDELAGELGASGDPHIDWEILEIEEA